MRRDQQFQVNPRRAGPTSSVLKAFLSERESMSTVNTREENEEKEPLGARKY